MLSTDLIILNYPVILCHWCSTTVALETYPLGSQYKSGQVKHRLLLAASSKFSTEIFGIISLKWPLWKLQCTLLEPGPLY